MWYVSRCLVSPPVTVKCFGLHSPSVETLAVYVFPAAEMWWAMRPGREEAVKKPHKGGALRWLLFALPTTSFASSLALLVFLLLHLSLSLPVTWSGAACWERGPNPVHPQQRGVCWNDGGPGVPCNIKKTKCINGWSTKTETLISKEKSFQTNICLPPRVFCCIHSSCFTEHAHSNSSYTLEILTLTILSGTTTRQELHLSFHISMSLLMFLNMNQMYIFEQLDGH